jgi:hypothetical protein
VSWLLVLVFLLFVATSSLFILSGMTFAIGTLLARPLPFPPHALRGVLDWVGTGVLFSIAFDVHVMAGSGVSDRFRFRLLEAFVFPVFSFR